MRVLVIASLLSATAVAHAQGTLRIMPLGDSITQARKGDASYRYFLFHGLKSAGYCVDFVGSLTGVQGGSPKFPDFDQDHEGHWGWRADQIAAKAYDFAKASKPDIVLLHAGSNDLYQKQGVSNAIADLGKVIDELRRAQPTVKIFLAKVLPFAAKYNVDVTPLNNAIPGLAATKFTEKSPVWVVDQNTGFDTKQHSYDGVHPNEEGEKRMAYHWVKGLKAANIANCRGTRPRQLRVLPVGDSITMGRAKYATYRYFLWHALRASGHDVDFVGSLKGVQSGSPKWTDFDQDHEGHWSWKAEDAAANIYGLAKAAEPDVALLHLGSVDLFNNQSAASTVTEIGKTIDELRRAQPRVKILLSQVIPFGPKYKVDVRDLNKRLPALVASKTSSTSPIVLVDHYTGWDTKIHSIDDVHPSVAGDQRMAMTFVSGMLSLNLPKSRPPLEDKLRVMPFGDSITVAREGYASYRYFLGQQLEKSGHDVDFVGGQHGVQKGLPKFKNFDQDHEGHWGWRADEIAARAYEYAKIAQPDVVLAHVGSNDMFQKQSVASTVKDIEKVIDELRRATPNVTVLLAQIIPFGAKYNVDVRPLNAALPALVARKNTTASPVILVDHYTGFDAKTLLYDAVHPNEAGEKKMADTWHKAILKQKLTLEGTVAMFGGGCAGKNGIPKLSTSKGSRPVAGKTFTMTFTRLPTNGLLVATLAAYDTRWKGNLLPLRMSAWGMGNCWLQISPEADVQLGVRSTSAFWTTRLLNDPTTVGLNFFVQAYATDPSANWLGVVLTNPLICRIGMQ